MPVETLIATIRHGRTTFNGERRYAGSLDVPLSEKGLAECRRAAGRLAGRSFDVAVSSTMTRAVDTAKILVGDKTPLAITPLCQERNFGILEGLTWDEVLKLDPPILMIEVGGDLHTVNPRGGEPFEDVWERAKAFRRFLFENYRGRRILVVSHGVFLQMFHGLLRGLSCILSLAFLPANLELTQFRFLDDGLVAESSESLNGDSVEPEF